MKRFIFTFILLYGAIFAYAQSNQITIKPGDKFPYYPTGVEAIAFKGNTPLPIVSKIMKIDDKTYEFSLTVAALSNNTADGTYPIIISYYLKIGDEIEFKKKDTYMDSILIKFKVTSLNWNTLVLQEKPSEKTNAPNPSEDSL